ncbi:MAG TPA: NnrU family protein [Geopsychrobacteraceae bacterium]|nr:NnrU family protein [Geopsychrobacteraceae bacterium]
MVIMILGLVIFFVVHMISIINDPWRDRMAATPGELTWKGVYSLLSLIGFGLLDALGLRNGESRFDDCL